MSRGRRYNDEPKLNVKKIATLIIAIIVIILFIIGIKNILKKEDTNTNNFSEISYFTMYDNGKWGVINSKGGTVIEPTNDEMIVIPNSKMDIFLCVYEVNYSDNTYKTKAINANNEQLFTSYNNVEALSNYSQDNNIWYEMNTLKVEKDGKYGLIDLNGTEILSCVYDKIDTIKGIQNSILIQKDNLYGLVNASGNIIVEPKYEQVTALTNDYKNGYIVKSSDGKYGVIGIDKTQILDCKYSDIKQVYGSEMYIVSENDTWKIVKNSNDEGTEIKYSDVKAINNENFVVVNDENYGIIDVSQNEKVKLEYQYIEYVFSDNYIAKKDNKYGIINSSGEVLIQFDYDSISYDKEADCLIATKSNDSNKYLIDRNLELKLTVKEYTVSNGYIRANINDDYKLYNLKFEEKSNREVYPNNTLFVAKNEGKYGLVNKDGTLICSYQYDDITEQNEYGFIAVKKDGKWGIIDQYGNTVVETKFELSNIEKNCVIGKWHLAEDVNTRYFVCE